MTMTRVLTAIAFIAWMTAAWGDMPNVFRQGDTARGSDVNENFNALDSRVTAMEQAQGGTALDMADFSSPYTERTYRDVWSTDGNCDQMTQTELTETASVREVKEVFTNSADGQKSTAADCDETVGPHSTRHYATADGEQRITERVFLDAADAATTLATLEFDPGLLVFQDGMSNNATIMENGRSTLSFADGVTPGYTDAVHFAKTTYLVLRTPAKLTVNGTEQTYSPCVSSRQAIAAATYYSDISAVVCKGIGIVSLRDHYRGRFWLLHSAH